jgi:hypothetical protein
MPGVAAFATFGTLDAVTGAVGPALAVAGANEQIQRARIARASSERESAFMVDFPPCVAFARSERADNRDVSVVFYRDRPGVEDLP